MKGNSPRNIIILISVLASIFQFLILLFLDRDLLIEKWQIVLIASISNFLIIYGISTYLINQFFIQTINPIYKIIRTVKLQSNEIEEEIEDKKFTKNIEIEVDKRAKEKTRQIAHLREMEKYRKEFLGDVSHELKTPIFTIQGYISTLIDGGINDPNINTKYLHKTEKSIDRMITIVEDLISISELETQKLNLNYTDFDISLVIKEILETQEIRAKKNNISLSCKKMKSHIVRADKRLIYQVLLNLIVNSINYGKPGGHTEISIFDMDKIFMIEIADNGIGISNEDIPRLFERFYRVDKSRSKETGGTGLGLSICKHILEAHQQTINVTSQINQGSSFSFTLEKTKFS